MRRFILLLLPAVLLPSALYPQAVPSMLSFEERVFDFGEIPEENGEVSHTFFFKNTGKMPVIVDEVFSGCGCTRHEYSKEPVLPGQNGKLIITYQPRYRPGFFSKEIVVLSNNQKSINRLWIKGTVIPCGHPVEEDYPYSFGNGLYFNLKVLPFGKVAEGKEKQIKLRYANDTDNPMILSFMVEGNQQQIRFTNPGNLLPKERGEMLFSYSLPKGVRGEISIAIYPVVNGKKSEQPLQVRITGID